jgi:hypothetical protein
MGASRRAGAGPADSPLRADCAFAGLSSLAAIPANPLANGATRPRVCLLAAWQQQFHWRADRFSFGLLARVTVGVTKRRVTDIY